MGTHSFIASLRSLLYKSVLNCAHNFIKVFRVLVFQSRCQVQLTFIQMNLTISGVLTCKRIIIVTLLYAPLGWYDQEQLYIGYSNFRCQYIWLVIIIHLFFPRLHTFKFLSIHKRLSSRYISKTMVTG